MLRDLVVVREQLECARLEHRPLIVIAGERADRVERGEPRQRDERLLVGVARQVGHPPQLAFGGVHLVDRVGHATMLPRERARATDRAPVLARSSS